MEKNTDRYCIYYRMVFKDGTVENWKELVTPIKF